MKFSWKIFISTFLLVLVALNIGEIVIVSISFNRELHAEVEITQYENLMMKSEIALLSSNYNKAVFNSEYENLEAILKTLSSNWTKEGRYFQVLNSKGIVISENSPKTEFLFINKVLSQDNVAFYKVFKQKKSYYLQMYSVLKIDKEIVLVQNMKDISQIFDSRNKLIQITFWVIWFIGSVCGIFNWIIAKWLSKPIIEMTNATNRIMSGDMNARVRVESKDELGILAGHFNTMTESLQSSIHELESVARRQEEFAGNFAHEVKTPLTSIIGYADILRRQKLDEETIIKSADYIYSEGQRLEKLSIKMLELIVEKNSKVQKSKISIEKLIYDAVEILGMVLDKNNIQVSMNIINFDVNVDVELMKTVFVNLIDNARKSIDQDGVITISTKKIDGKVEVSISDNGRGIAEEDLNRITEAFYRVDKSRARKEGGAGLGLSICTQILKLHNGEIRFESKLNYGTYVFVNWRDDLYEKL